MKNLLEIRFILKEIYNILCFYKFFIFLQYGLKKKKQILFIENVLFIFYKEIRLVFMVFENIIIGVEVLQCVLIM